MLDELKFGVPEVMHHILLPIGEEIIHDNDTITSGNQTIHEVRADETCPVDDRDAKPLSLNPQGNLAEEMKRHPMGGERSIPNSWK